MKKAPLKFEHYTLTQREIFEFGKKCAEVMNVHFEQMVSKTRRRVIVNRRQISHCLCVEKFKTAALVDIGAVLGNVDHATVLHSLKAIDNLIDTNRDVRDLFIRARKALSFEIDPKYRIERMFIPTEEIQDFLKTSHIIGNILSGEVQLYLLAAAENLNIDILFFAVDGIIIKKVKHEETNPTT